ncbi:MAG TPA: carboxymuconolactone decarboxylase family protein [Gemmatimonadaceae bacterium]|jgi:alkylhydroperoxidase/carboxymuconolactone decarboxylase family protein YurZ|nr:carboxymuconolactone decarboxylase family protein [Gemmatimonadaceae bacterium]
MDDYRDRLRKLAVRDDALVADLLVNEASITEACRLDAKTHALVRLTATVAVEACSSSYQHAVDRALAAGATRDEIAGTLMAVVSLTGVPRAVTAAPKLALALGYDVEAALEKLDP